MHGVQNVPIVGQKHTSCVLCETVSVCECVHVHVCGVVRCWSAWIRGSCFPQRSEVTLLQSSKTNALTQAEGKGPHTHSYL